LKRSFCFPFTLRDYIVKCGIFSPKENEPQRTLKPQRKSKSFALFASFAVKKVIKKPADFSAGFEFQMN